MEEFLKRPFLDILYDTLSEEFEEIILKNKEESKIYNELFIEEKKLYNTLKELANGDVEKLIRLKKL